MNAVLSSPPVWFNEGLAEYYRTLEVTANGRQATIGRLQTGHVLRLRDEWLPLAAVLAVGHDSPLYNERDKASVFYAESWALMHYLALGENGAYAKQIGPFLTLLFNGVAPEQACEQALKLPLAQLEKKLRAYIAQDRWPMTVVTFGQRIASVGALPVTPVADADAHATLAELLLRLRRPEEARAQLDAALELDGGCAPAHEVMGRLLAEASQFAPARDHLAAAVAAPGATWLTHYTYGRVLVQTRTDASAAGDDDIARAFARAIEMNPQFAEGYAQLAWVRSQSANGLDEAIRAARKATELEPGKDQYASCWHTFSRTGRSSRPPAPSSSDWRAPRRTLTCSSPPEVCWHTSIGSRTPQRASPARRRTRSPERTRRQPLRRAHPPMCRSSGKRRLASSVRRADSRRSTALQPASGSRSP